MSREKAIEFLKKYSMQAELFEPETLCAELIEGMEYGLSHFTENLPMIPTYLSAEGSLAPGSRAIVIDAGGTNFRTAVVTFEKGGYSVSHLVKKGMPGIGKAASWAEFIAFVADSIEPIAPLADDIGFCFSYAADSTPERDAIAHIMSKEVVIPDSEGKLLGATLTAELERRGITGKRVTVLNDTSAVLLGTAAVKNAESYSSFIGLVSGTGVNACCMLPEKSITKLSLGGEKEMIVNLEAASYANAPRGVFDTLLDAESAMPGKALYEKMTAGVYLGELVRLMLLRAAEEGELSAAAGEKVRSLGKINSAVIDAWAAGEGLDALSATEEDGEFISTLCLEMFRRAARGDCAYIMAILTLNGKGRDKPVLLCAEGSLVQKGRFFRPMFEELLNDYVVGRMGRGLELVVSEETTLPGSAAAALLNR